MTWQRRHCIICAWDNEVCDSCGCHEEPKPVATQQDLGFVWHNGTAPTSAGNTPEGLTNNDYRGVEMADPNLSGSWLARLDGCPRCVDNAELPYGLTRTPNKGDMALYKCHDCGHRWHTMWKPEAAA